MSLPDIQNWFTPEANNDQSDLWQVGKIYYDAQIYTPDEVEAFAAELVKLAALARQNDAGRPILKAGTSMSDIKFFVTVSQTIETIVEVAAPDPQSARRLVDRREFSLPARNEWNLLNDYRYAVADADHNDLIDEEGNDLTDQ